MSFRSLQWRLVIIIIAITISLMFFVAIFLNNQVESIYYNNFKNAIDRGFDVWKADKSFSVGQLKEELAENKVAKSDFAINEDYKSYAIVEKTGKILHAAGKKYDEDITRYQNEILSSMNLLAVLGDKVTGNTSKLNRTDVSVFYDYAKRVTLSDGDYVILYFRYDREAWGKAITEFNNTIINSLMLAVVASLVVGYMLSKTITVPVVNIMHKAQMVAQGNFDQVLEVKSDDEIGKLTMTFNYMANELKNTLAEISSEKNKIETILNYMTDGVIAFNLKGEVIHSNPAAERMLGISEEKLNYGFNEFSRMYDLGINLEEIVIFESSSVREKSFKANDRFLRVYFAITRDEAKKPEGIIAVLQDITEQQKLENMRREFVANVSHELRTPITSIKSYAETLLDGAVEDRETTEKFLTVINSEADRMTRLVKDLLQLSRLDNQQMQWNIRQIDFASLIRSCVEKMQIECVNKGHKLECFTIGDIPSISADADRVEQVMLNLLSNAIKYTDEGGNITVYIGKRHSEVYVKVADTGSGIPKDDIPRIFERFYRVDKARSREMGGTGLGLAIAREIVEAHEGTISISSELGKGTEITVKLPIKCQEAVEV